MMRATSNLLSDLSASLSSSPKTNQPNEQTKKARPLLPPRPLAPRRGPGRQRRPRLHGLSDAGRRRRHRELEGACVGGRGGSGGRGSVDGCRGIHLRLLAEGRGGGKVLEGRERGGGRQGERRGRGERVGEIKKRQNRNALLLLPPFDPDLKGGKSKLISTLSSLLDPTSFLLLPSPPPSSVPSAGFGGFLLSFTRFRSMLSLSLSLNTDPLHRHKQKTKTGRRREGAPRAGKGPRGPGPRARGARRDIRGARPQQGPGDGGGKAAHRARRHPSARTR